MDNDGIMATIDRFSEAKDTCKSCAAFLLMLAASLDYGNVKYTEELLHLMGSRMFDAVEALDDAFDVLGNLRDEHANAAPIF